MYVRFRDQITIEEITITRKKFLIYEKDCCWTSRNMYIKKTYGRIARLNFDVRTGLSAACRTLISNVVACFTFRMRGMRLQKWMPPQPWEAFRRLEKDGGAGELHERGRFTIREISFLWGLGFLGNPITGVKCDLGSWPYTVHRPSYRLSMVMVYSIGVSYLFGTDINRRAPRCSMASHSHGRFQPRSRNYFLKAFGNRYSNRRKRGWIGVAVSRASGKMATQSRYYIKY